MCSRRVLRELWDTETSRLSRRHIASFQGVFTLKIFHGKKCRGKILFKCTWQDASKWQQLSVWQRGCPHLTSAACSAVCLKTKQQNTSKSSGTAGITAQHWPEERQEVSWKLLEDFCSDPLVERTKRTEQRKGEMWGLGNMELLSFCTRSLHCYSGFSVSSIIKWSFCLLIGQGGK